MNSASFASIEADASKSPVSGLTFDGGFTGARLTIPKLMSEIRKSVGTISRRRRTM